MSELLYDKLSFGKIKSIKLYLSVTGKNLALLLIEDTITIYR